DNVGIFLADLDFEHESVQFGVVKPQRSAGTYFFDMKMLLAAKVALYLKESLGTSTSVLSKLMNVFSASEAKLRTQNRNYVVFNCRLTAEEEPIKLGVPFRAENYVPGKISPGPKDDPFCLCSEQGKADFIVTLNPKDFPEERLRAMVVSPDRFHARH